MNAPYYEGASVRFDVSCSKLKIWKDFCEHSSVQKLLFVFGICYNLSLLEYINKVNFEE